MKQRFETFYTGLLLFLLFTSMANSAGNTLNAVGATFPFPLYESYFNTYQEESGLKVRYEALGSSKGVKELLGRSVDFGATDFFLSDSVLIENPEILHVPTCVGAATLTYNLPDDINLYLTPELIAGIFLGEITNWQDSKIAKINPESRLPDLPITVVHRYDGSGTTFIFSDYLSKVSAKWRKSVGRGKVLPFPVGYGASGNSGVARLISRAEGAIGYVESTYAGRNGLPKAFVQNREGNFIVPTPETLSHAADVYMPTDTRVSITNTEAKKGYPISGYTWLIFFKEQNYNQRDKSQALALAELLLWILDDGQELNPSLNYAPLPSAAIVNATKNVFRITYDGELLIKK